MTRSGTNKVAHPADPACPLGEAVSWRVLVDLAVVFFFFSSHTASVMSSKQINTPTGFLTPQYIQNVYAPSAILIVGAVLVNKTLVPVAIAIAAALAGYQYTNSSRE
jgi:hypothetical protein